MKIGSLYTIYTLYKMNQGIILNLVYSFRIVGFVQYSSIVCYVGNSVIYLSRTAATEDSGVKYLHHTYLCAVILRMKTYRNFPFNFTYHNLNLT